jgi:hypothetical protein
MLEWKNNSEEEIIWKELCICVITWIYIRIIKSKDDIYISKLKKRIDDKNIIPRILSLKITLTSENYHPSYFNNFLNILLLLFHDFILIDDCYDMINDIDKK